MHRHRKRERDVGLIVGRISRSSKNQFNNSDVCVYMAEGVGFEPTVELPPRRFSRPLP